MRKRIIAVDFDGCLCSNEYPAIGEPNIPAIEELIASRAAGNRIILWTCRRDRELHRAIMWCAARGLVFDAVNENLPDVIERFGGDCRKVFANEYWDDRAHFVRYEAD